VLSVTDDLQGIFCLFVILFSGESAASNSNEGLSEPANISHSSSFIQPATPASASIPNKSVQLRVLDDPDLNTEAELPRLEDVIPKELLRKLKPKEKKRQEVINGSSCCHLFDVHCYF